MNHLNHLSEAQLDTPSIVTIGMFDGVHLGHQALIKQLVDEAEATARKAVVLTFFPHPDVVLRDLSGRYYLTTAEQRAALLGELGVDVVITHPFDASVRETRADEFVERLVAHLKMKSLWVGSDFALGYRREGNVDYLTKLGETHGYTVKPVDLVSREEGGTTITSTRIRQLIAEGDILGANSLLGRSYAVQGEVIEGDKRGRSIGFPTANMAVWEKQMLPAHGVYAGWVEVDGSCHMAVANVGVRPTFAGKKVTVEPYILDFDEMIYGKKITFSFEQRLRGEQKFDGIDALKAQLQADIARGREILEAQVD